MTINASSAWVLPVNILYVARDRGSAELAGFALGSIASEVVVSWAGTPDQACRWIDEHRDVAALVVEVGSDIRAFEQLVAHARGAGLTVPLIGVPLTDADDVLLTLAVRADAIVRRDAAFLDKLREIVSRTLRLMEPRPHRPADSLARERESPRLQLVSDRDRVACLDLGRLLADAEKGRQALEKRVADAEAARQRAQHQHASALEQVRAHLAAHQQQADTRQKEAINALAGLRAKLVTQAAALVQLEQQANADRHAAAEHTAQCQAQFDRELATERAKREALAATLTEVEAEYQKATSRHTVEMAAAREAASDREAAVEHAAAERAAIAQREFEAALRGEKAARDRALAEQNAAYQQAQADRIARLRDESFARQRAEGECAAVRDQFTKYQQQTETRLAEIQRQHSAAIALAEERRSELQKFEVKLAAQQVSFEQAIAAQMAEHEKDCRRLVAQHKERLIGVRDELAKAQQHADQLTTYLEQADTRFAEAQRQHAAAIAQAEARQAQSNTVVQQLEAKLTDALTALQQHESQAATDRQAAIDQAATREREFETVLHEEKAARDRALAEQKGAFDQILADRIVQLLDEQDARRQVEAEYAAARDQFTTHQQQDETQFAEAQRQHAAAIAAAEARFSELQKAAETRQVQSIAVAKNLEAKLTDAMAALQHQQSEAANDRQAAIEQGAIRKREFEAALMVARDDVATAQHAQRQSAGEAAVSEQRRAELETALVQEVATRQRVEAALLDEREARQRAEAEQATTTAAAHEQFTTYQQQAEARFAEVQREHAVAIAAADAALQHRESEAANQRQLAIEQAATRQREFEAALHEQQAARDRALAEQKTAFDRSSSQAEQRRAELETALAQEVATRQRMEAALLDERGARQRAEAEQATTTAAARDQFTTYQQQAEARFAEAQREHGVAIAAADVRLSAAQKAAAARSAEQQHQADAQLAAVREAFSRQEQTAKAQQAQSAALAKSLLAKLSQATNDRQAAIDQAATRQREFEAALHEEKAARDRSLAEQQAAFDRSSAEAEQRRAAFETALAQEVATRQRVEAALLDERAARQRAEVEHATAMAAARDHFTTYQQQAEARFAEVQREHAVAIAAADAALQHRESEAANQQQLAIGQAASRQREFEAALHEEKAARDRALAGQKASEQKLADRTAQLFDEQGARRQVEAEYAAARNQFTTYQQQAEARFAEAQREHARSTAAALQHRDSQAALFDAALHEQKAARDRALAEAEQRRAELETALAQEGATRLRAEAQLLDERGARQRADAEYAAALQKAVADQRVAADQFAAQRVALQSSVAQEVSRRKAVEAALACNRSELAALHQTVDHVRRAENDNRRRYERTPIGLWRCGRDRSILQVNQALIALLRYKSADELLAVDFSTVFESPGELQWIVDRCLASRSTETLETTWRTKRGATIAVRLIGTATSPDVVDFVVIDLTSVRALEERLRKSQRMESVARYASEIAVTCDKLLRRVNYQGHQWLTRVDSDSAHLGATWLEDVDRTAGLLKRLAVYGEEQRKAPELVDIKDVLQDLAPILKRVAGSNVAIVMPKVMASYKLDLDLDRVERILVNVAAYGRQQMPLGGRLTIEVGAIVLDRTFVEKRPNVRPGPYVVLTVAATKGATPPQWSIVRGATSGIDNQAPQIVTLDVDLGTLEGIVSDCGGHLWIQVEPGGNMELRIHLPRRMVDARLPERLAGRLRWSKLAGVGT